MGPGFKYHVVTIAAVFFALTIGLVVGSLYVSPQVADGQKRAIVSLRDTINKDVAEQRTDIERYQKFVAQAAPLLMRDRLAGENVAIIQTGDYPESVSKVREALLQARARVLSVTHIDEAFNRSDERLKAHMASLQEEQGPNVEADAKIPADRAELAAAFAAMFTKQSGAPQPEALLTLLQNENYLHLEADSHFDRPVRYVVIVAGSRAANATRPANVDAPLIEALQKNGVKVVACEPQNAETSDVAAYHTLNIAAATVDNIDSVIGQCALILALRGDRDDYGVKDTAHHLLPALPERQTSAP